MGSRIVRVLALCGMVVAFAACNASGSSDDVQVPKDATDPGTCGPYQCDKGQDTADVLDVADVSGPEAEALTPEPEPELEATEVVDEDQSGEPDDVVDEDLAATDLAGEAAAPTPKIKVVPGIIDFSYIGTGITGHLPFSIQSVGTQALSVTKITLDAPSSVSLLVGFQPKQVGTLRQYTIQPPKMLKVGDKFDGQVQFAPLTGAAVQGTMLVYSSDPSQPDGYPVYILGNKVVPCVRFNPDKIDIPATVLGQTVVAKVRVESCSQIAVVVFDPAIDGTAAADGLTMDFSDFPGGVAPTLAKPLTLVPGEYYTLKLKFAPTHASQTGPDGKPLAQKYQLALSSNSFDGAVFLPVSAIAVAKQCTTPKISIKEGTSVDVATLLHLSSAGSFSPFGDIVEYAWSIDQPSENFGSMIPSMIAPEPAFLAGVPGQYTFHLAVRDDKGNDPCGDVSTTVQVTSQNQIVFLLTWDTVNPVTPVPPNLGPDLDLHFLHPKALEPGGDSADLNPADGVPDGWFDTHWDCFWFNPHPNDNADSKYWWAPTQSTYIQDKTNLLFDSTDGSGPELLEHGTQFLKDKVYHFGVHFFDDYGYGPARATMKIYLAGTLVYQYTQELEKEDLWDVGTVTCADWDPIPIGTPRCKQAAVNINPGTVIRKGYVNPATINP